MKKAGISGLLLLISAIAFLCWFRSHQSQQDLKQQQKAAKASTTAAQTSLFEEARGELSWRDVETPDYHQYVENLRRIGCPEGTIDDIIVADVNALFLEKSKPPLGSLSESLLRFYTTRPGKTSKRSIIAETKTSLDSLNRERLELIDKIVGHQVEKFKTAATPWTYAVEQLATNNYPYLSAEKRAQLSEIRARLREKYTFQPPTDRGLNEDEVRLLEESRRTFEADVAKLLTPEEFQTYLLHSSSESLRLTQKLGKLTVEETEYKELLQVTRDFYDKYDFYIATNNPQIAAKAAQDEAALLNRYKEILGDNRYEEYLRANDVVYRDLNAFSEQTRITEKQVDDLYNLSKRVEQEVRSVRDLALDEAERQREIAEIISSGQKQVRDILNEETRDIYLRNRASRWLRAPPATPVSQFREPGVGTLMFTVE